MRLTNDMDDRTWTADVVVVGAGFAGLAAARELTRLGHDVLVVEGRDRVGGRSYTSHVAGVPVDMGGTFVGPTQDAVLAFAAELGIPTVPTYHDGANLIRWRGAVRSYSGTIPPVCAGNSPASPGRYRSPSHGPPDAQPDWIASHWGRGCGRYMPVPPHATCWRS
jgi:monoamine oxidase